jgi:hypothetical protein
MPEEIVLRSDVRVTALIDDDAVAHARYRLSILRDPLPADEATRGRVGWPNPRRGLDG